MARQRSWFARLMVASGALASGVAFWQCTDEGGAGDPPPGGSAGQAGGAAASGGAGVAGASPAACRPNAGGEVFPQRRLFASGTTVPAAELKGRVDGACANCHLAQAQGGFHYDDGLEGLRAGAAPMAAAMIGGSMPKDRPGSQVELGRLLERWAGAGFPPAVTVEGGGATDDGAYRLPPERAEAMTELGDCLPAASLAHADGSRDGLDATFAAAASLPDELAATDAFTFDVARLAAAGTFAYAPTYQLWTDDAKKLRFVHVPKGQRVAYDAARRRFHIPDNTRFYKTFFKRVVEPDGHVAYRKIETRLIVVRTPWQASLFGTYVWDEAESRAVLNRDPYRSGEPFADRTLAYVTDEAGWVVELDNGNVVSADAATPGAYHPTRNYLIPGRDRCVQCHQGSEGQNFVLGFTPLQVNRRPPNEGGVEAAPGASAAAPGPDEGARTQVERLVGYGVLGDVAGPDALPKLEQSAGERAPRNDEELRAQAYMVGNCAHCHNANGFAAQSSPALKPFDLSPGGVVFGMGYKPADAGDVLRGLPFSGLSRTTRVPGGGDFGYFAPGDPVNSILYRRMLLPSHLRDEKAVAYEIDGHVHQQMPLGGVGLDCRGVRTLGRWIASVPDPKVNPDPAASLRRYDQREDACPEPADVSVARLDFTEPQNPWVPHRPDWATDPAFAPWRDLDVTDPDLLALATKVYPLDFWVNKPGCAFPAEARDPNTGAPVDTSVEQAPWAYDTFGSPTQPLGRIWSARAGAFMFDAVCSNCHGKRADSNTGMTTGLAALDPNVHVANFATGLFGPLANPGAHLRATFEGAGGLGPDGAAKYLVYMASGGTKVQFPPGFVASFIQRTVVENLNSQGLDVLAAPDQSVDVTQLQGNMLEALGVVCARASNPASPPDPERVNSLRLFRDVCEFKNPPPAGLALTPTSPEPAVRAWVARAQANAGMLIYYYLKDALVRQAWFLPVDRCDLARFTPAAP